MRYSRQEKIFGKDGQKVLGKKTVAIVGIGATGSVSAELLARAGVGRLVIIDRDVVEINNLQSQILYNETDVGLPKAIIAKKRLKKVNSEIKIESFAVDLTFENIEILKETDIVLDCTDNLETRFLINDYCLKNQKPWIYSAGIKTYGTVIPFFSKKPCFRCVFEHHKSSETCETAGILASTTATVSSLQVIMAFKILLGKTVETEMLRFNVWNNTIEKIKIKENKNCSACKGNYEFLEGIKGSNPVKLCGRNSYQIQGEKKNLK